jgi:hypothetical protein
LCRRGQQELILGTRKTTQSQPIHLQNTFHMPKECPTCSLVIDGIKNSII